jgi:ABC-type Fe3+-hydroxamate transport system substrate-binding protein
MTLKPIPRIRVDFNELVGPDLVLLAKSDVVKSEDGSELLLQPGLPVIAFEYNGYADGAAEYLYAQGRAEKNDPAVNGEWTRNAKWCCRFKDGVQVSESPI